MSDLERMAQEAGERRLAFANATLYEEDEGVEMPAELADEQLAGPYCGCDTCVVREVLDAAWQYLITMAREEVSA